MNAMEITTHHFAWESDESHKVFWRYQEPLVTRAQNDVAKLTALCDLQPPAKVLDVGCGLGLHLAAFGRQGFVGTGIDIADYAVADARRHCHAIPGCRVLKLRGSEMTWECEFDLVYALAHPLGFMPEIELKRHLQRMWAAVKHGGRLLLQVPYTLEAAQTALPVHTWNVTNGTYTLVDKRLVHGNIKQEHCIIIDPAEGRIQEYFEEQRYYTWSEIVELLRACGVKQVKSLRDIDGNAARNGDEARVFMIKKTALTELGQEEAT
ncbi:MAG: class I SAM-dependent methyltransferase [Chloroflexi bacterium]|nr:class I SAM-dependent methyltransferase [Chloroflexota bacterium]